MSLNHIKWQIVELLTFFGSFICGFPPFSLIFRCRYHHLCVTHIFCIFVKQFHSKFANYAHFLSVTRMGTQTQKENKEKNKKERIYACVNGECRLLSRRLHCLLSIVVAARVATKY